MSPAQDQPRTHTHIHIHTHTHIKQYPFQTMQHDVLCKIQIGERLSKLTICVLGCAWPLLMLKQRCVLASLHCKLWMTTGPALLYSNYKWEGCGTATKATTGDHDIIWYTDSWWPLYGNQRSMQNLCENLHLMYQTPLLQWHCNAATTTTTISRNFQAPHQECAILSGYVRLLRQGWHPSFEVYKDKKW